MNSSQSFEEISQELLQLKKRLVAGDLSQEAFHRLRDEVTAGLSTSELSRHGIDLSQRNKRMLRPSGVVSMVEDQETDLELSPGTMLMDRWRITRELGRGGFGVVCLAEDTSLEDTLLAVKVLAPEMVERSGLLQRFRREVMVMRRLHNERIVSVFDYADDLSKGLAMITMEYVDGCDVQGLLHEARERKERIPVPLVLKIFQQTLEALHAAHSEGLIHRDVTPGNILLAGGSAKELLADSQVDPRIKLVDFGLATLMEGGEAKEQCELSGTISYVAPEISDPSVTVTGKADVYGVGAVVYEMLSGKTPFHTGSKPVQELCSGLSPDMIRLVNSCVRADPDSRPSAEDALKVFEAQGSPTSREQSSQVLPPSLPVETSQPQDQVLPLPPDVSVSPEHRRGILLPLIGIFVILLLGAGGLFWFTHRSEAPRLPLRPDEGDQWKNPKTGATTIFVPKRDYMMGCVPQDKNCKENERPRHQAHIGSFWMDAEEVSVRAFVDFLNSQKTTVQDDIVYINEKPVYDLKNSVPGGGPPWEERISRAGSQGFDALIKFKDHPVVLVSWYGAADYCAWAGGRLPTEVEWEGAARIGAADFVFPCGDRITQRDADFSVGSERISADGTIKSGSFPPSAGGFYDLAGNVWEWVADSYHGDYSSSSNSGTGGVEQKILRGGAWNSNDVLLRISERGFTKPGSMASYIGFRCVYDTPPRK